MKTIGNFTETNKKVTITFAGWDGKSYDGEGETTKVWVDSEGKEFVHKYSKKAHCFFEITDRTFGKFGYKAVEFVTFY